MKLHARGIASSISSLIVGEIAHTLTVANGKERILSVNDGYNSAAIGPAAIISSLPFEGLPQEFKLLPSVHSAGALDHLAEGDIVLIKPDGELHTLYRRQSDHNALFVTDRCNSNCLMCSQPPKDRDDIGFFLEINMRLLELIPKDIHILGITGGEPTLLGPRLYFMLRKIKDRLPDTEIHMLTNGRAFAWMNYAELVASVDNPRMVYAIPLYSDYYALHDYIVQAKDAFSQTTLGIHNLARLNQRIEIRIVLHKQVIPRLKQLANFIYRNMPFVDHVALMGLEYTGYTPHNDPLLWIDPYDYVEQLNDAVEFLALNGVNVSIYNLQLCLLPKHLWKYCRKSISDWKQIYIDECMQCDWREECGGLFMSSTRKHSSHIAPMKKQ